jgi:hypothetical protein
VSLFEAFQRRLPSWLTSGDGGKVAASIALLADDFIARAKLGLLARYPDHADEDALAAIGRDRLIRRGINEPAAAYAVRLKRAFTDHKTRGTPYTLLTQLRAYLQADCVVRIVDRRGNWWTIDADGTRSSSLDTGNWDWDGEAATPRWARFWVIIYPAGGTDPWAPSGLWGDATLWGDGTWGHPTLTIGTTATVDQVASVRAIIREWKPANAICEWVIVAFDAATFTPAGATDPNGEWARWGDSTGGPVRLQSARYWKGVSA